MWSLLQHWSHIAHGQSHVLMHIYRLLVMSKCLLRMIHGILVHLLVQLMVGTALHQHRWR